VWKREDKRAWTVEAQWKREDKRAWTIAGEGGRGRGKDMD